jgi:DNA topoisomerase-1
MEKREAKLYPTELGFLVTDLLVEHFQDIMNVEYTAAMEQSWTRSRRARTTSSTR